MTDEQINAAIAKVLNAYEHWMVQKDYCNDLNAMHEAEKILVDGIAATYAECLSETTEAEWSDDKHFFCATARQRAEAFLRTLDKWKSKN